MRRIFADFNSQDEDGNVYLNCLGSMDDIVKLDPPLAEGERVLLYTSDGDVEVEADVYFDLVWRARCDDTTTVFLK